MTPTGSQTEPVLQQALLLPSTAEVDKGMRHVSSGKSECPLLDHDSFCWHTVKDDPKTSTPDASPHLNPRAGFSPRTLCQLMETK